VTSPSGDRDVFLSKRSTADGSELWQRSLSTTAGEEGYSAIVDWDGNPVIGGTTQGSLPGNTLRGTSDLFVASFTPDGVQSWVRQLGGTSDSGGAAATVVALQLDGFSDLYVTGTVQGALDGTTSMGKTDFFVAKWEASGLFSWVRQMGTEQDDRACGIGRSPSGPLFMAGDTLGALDGSLNAGLSDVFVKKL
jgi:hypothetical protein